MAKTKTAQKELTLREKKSARLKLTILESAVELIGDRPFKDLHIEEICEKAEISAVTLYKYFPQKEDILVYYFRVWCLHRAVEQQLNNITGILAIEYLFESAAQEIREKPGLMYSLIGFISTLEEFPTNMEPSYAEKHILYPDVIGAAEKPVPDLKVLFLRHLREAIERKELSEHLDPVEVMKIFQTIFYGGAITAQLLEQDPMEIYEAHLSLMFDYFRFRPPAKPKPQANFNRRRY